MNKYKTTTEVFFWPLLIGATSAIGLISALIGDGIWDSLSWALLAVPIVIANLFSWRRN